MPAGLGSFLLFWNLNLGGGTAPAAPRLVSKNVIDVDKVQLFIVVDPVVLFVDADRVKP